MKNIKYLLLSLPFLLAGCREQPKWMNDLQTGSGSLVVYQRPSIQMVPIKLDENNSRLTAQVNQYFARHPDMLADIAKGLKLREREITDDFEPGAALADSQGNLAISYFGRYQSPQIMAGVKVLFLFAPKNELIRIFVYEVPLE